MSAETAPAPVSDKEFVAQFNKDLEAAMHGVAAKYKGMIQDFAVVVNWTPENHQKPYPKLVIETLRDTAAPDFDPVRQALEIGDLLNMGGTHILRQMLFTALQQLNTMNQQAQNKPKLVIPGQQ